METMPFLYCRNSSCLRFRETIIALKIHGLWSLVKDISFSLIGQHWLLITNRLLQKLFVLALTSWFIWTWLLRYCSTSYLSFAKFCPKWSLNFTRIHFWGQLTGAIENIGKWSVMSNKNNTIEIVVQLISPLLYDLEYLDCY